MNCISKTFMCSVIIFSILHTLVSLEYPTFDKYKFDQQHVSRFQTLYLVIFWFPRNVESVLRIIQSSRLIEVRLCFSECFTGLLMYKTELCGVRIHAEFLHVLMWYHLSRIPLPNFLLR